MAIVFLSQKDELGGRSDNIDASERTHDIGSNRIEGNSRLSMAWSLMAGIGYQVSERAILDVGYRYMDYGKAVSGKVDNTNSINPAVRINDITAHEVKIGLRYHFGATDAMPAYQPMK